MNPDDFPQNDRAELEAKVTALLLGELNPDEADALRQTISQDAALAKLHQRLRLTLDLVRETAATSVGALSEQPAPLKLSPARRESLLAHFKIVTPKELAQPRAERLSWIVKIAALVIFLVAARELLLPRFAGRSEQARTIYMSAQQQAQSAIRPMLAGADRPMAYVSANQQAQLEAMRANGTGYRLGNGTAKVEAKDVTLGLQAWYNGGGPVTKLDQGSTGSRQPATMDVELGPARAPGISFNIPGKAITASTASTTSTPSTTPTTPIYMGRTEETTAAGSIHLGLDLKLRGATVDQALEQLSESAGLTINRQTSTQVPGTVDLRSEVPLTTEETVDLLNKSLAGKGLTAIQDNKTLTITTLEDAQNNAGTPVNINNWGADIPKDSEVVTEVIPVHSLNPNEVVYNFGNMGTITRTNGAVGNFRLFVPDTAGKTNSIAAIAGVYDLYLSTNSQLAWSQKLYGTANLAGGGNISVTNSYNYGVIDEYGADAQLAAKYKADVAARTAAEQTPQLANVQVTWQLGAEPKPEAESLLRNRVDTLGAAEPAATAGKEMPQIYIPGQNSQAPSSDSFQNSGTLAGATPTALVFGDLPVLGNVFKDAAEADNKAAVTYDMAAASYDLATRSATPGQVARMNLDGILSTTNLEHGDHVAGTVFAPVPPAASAKVAAPPPREYARLTNPKANFQVAAPAHAALAAAPAIRNPQSAIRNPDSPIRNPQSAIPPAPQPEVQTRDNAFSTFSLNVSDVSFKLAAASLQNGSLPDPASVRSEEFINAFDYRDSEPAPGAPIGFASERAAWPFAHNRDLLRFSVKTAALGRQPGRPLNLVLLLDKSGSMERADRVAIIREALRVLATQLQPQDKLSVVVFARTARLWADGVSGSQLSELAAALEALTPEGGTNLEEAMRLAYETALRHYLANGENRVVVLTDGAANLGDVEPDDLKKKVGANRAQGIALDCFGVGWEDYNDNLLEVLSRAGGGRYGFINTPEEAATGFAGQLAGALRVAASDVKVQVEFNPSRVISWRQIGYAKDKLTKEQFRDNTVKAAQIGAAEAGNALYTVEINPAGDGPVCTVYMRYRAPGTANYYEHAWNVPYTGAALALDQASPAMRLAATASAFSEWLANSPYAGGVSLDQLQGYLRGVPEIYGADARPKLLETMLREARSISGK
jgi:Mg-chelatase subunit ChlD